MGAKVRRQGMGGTTGKAAAALPLTSKLRQTKLEEGWNPSGFGSDVCWVLVQGAVFLTGRPAGLLAQV